MKKQFLTAITICFIVCLIFAVQLYAKETDEVFIYDKDFFCASAMVNGVTPETAYINLIPRKDRDFDIKLVYSQYPDFSVSESVMVLQKWPDRIYALDIGLEFSSLNTFTYDKSNTSINIPLKEITDASCIYYQIFCREMGAMWQKSGQTRSFKTLYGNLSKGDKLSVVLIGDSHTPDDADLGKRIVVDKRWQERRLDGSYVNIFLDRLYKNPHYLPLAGSEENKLMNGFCLAGAIKHISENQKTASLLFDLGDSILGGFGYKFDGLGLEKERKEKDYEKIAQIGIERYRKIMSPLLALMPSYFVLGNHDGEENWNPMKQMAIAWRNKCLPMPDSFTHPEGGSGDENYYAFVWGKEEGGVGGVLFVVLDVCRYSGSVYKSPTALEQWTLGEKQLNWLEGVLRQSQARYKIILFHHVLGGWPSGSNEGITDYFYGRGSVFTESDYFRLGVVNPEMIEQVQVTRIAKENNVNMFIYGHDHVFHVRNIGKNKQGDNMYSLCVGSTKYGHDKKWWQGIYWQMFYGYAYEIPSLFYGVPGYTTLAITEEGIEVQYICSAYAPCPQLNNVFAQPGDVLFRKNLF